MNLHVPEEIKTKYPHMEFRGKQRIMSDKHKIKARRKEKQIKHQVDRTRAKRELKKSIKDDLAQ